MTPEKFQNNESNFAAFAEASILASELAVKEAVQKEYIDAGHKEIEYPSIAGVTTDTGDLDNPIFAGFIAHTGRMYGPGSREEIAVEFDESLINNKIIPEVALIPSNIDEPFITSPEFLRVVVSSLEVISNTQELGVTYEVSGAFEPYDKKNPFATEGVIKITNIKDAQGNGTGIQVVLLMGTSSDFSSSIIQDDARVSQEIANADINDNVLVSSPVIFPRIPSIVASVQDSSGVPLSSEDSLLLGKVALGLKIATRSLEVAGEDFSGETVVITLSDRSAYDMLELREATHPDFEWFRNLS